MALGLDVFDYEEMHKKPIEKQNFSKIKNVVYTWGNGLDSKLGFPDKENVYYPKKI